MYQSLGRATALSVLLLALACKEAGTSDPVLGDAGSPGIGLGAPDSGGTPADPGGSIAFAPSNVPRTALPAAVTGDLVWSGANCRGSSSVVIDTDTGATSCDLEVGKDYSFAKVAQSDGSMVAVFAARSIRLEQTMVVAVKGQSPLVLVASTTATILGRLDGAAVGGRGVSGGFTPPQNMAGNGNGPGAGGGGGPGGGGGGGHCGLGGKGAAGEAGGVRYGDARIVPLAGGSSGGNGSIYEAGAGGGAIQIVAGTRIQVGAAGAIHVGGAGGLNDSGGGSGGAILLEAPVVNIAGTLAANGGGGGATGGHRAASATADDQSAKGFADQAMVQYGGDGAAGATTDGGDARTVHESGGGGGGAGYIRINAGMAEITGKVSPSLTTPCATQGSLGS